MQNFLSHKTIPLLFATPGPANSCVAIISSLAILCLGIASYVTVQLWSGFPYFLVMSVLMIWHGCLCLFTTGANILYLFRYFLVWVLIFGTSLIWFMYSGQVFVAPFGLQYQTLENTQVLVLAGLISLVGSLSGWHFAFIKSKMGNHSELLLNKINLISMRRFGLMLATTFSLLYLWKAGGIITGERTYGSAEAGFDLEFGVFNLFHFTGIALILLGSLRDGRLNARYIAFAIATLIPGMLAGSRADFLPQAFVLFLLFFNPNVLDMIVRKKVLLAVKYFVVLLVVLVFAYSFATYIAIARTGIDPVAAMQLFLESESGRLINNIYGHKMLYFETGNMMLGGFYSAIVQVREGYTGLLWGESYLNYFLISPPAFLGLPRPLGLEWATAIDGIVMAQGGIFEVAEAYWNFGLVGCFFISFIWSYMFGWLLRSGLKASNYFFLTWFIVFGLHGFRSIWYQNFGYFRLMTVMLVVYVFGALLVKWYVVNRIRIHSTFHRATIRVS